MSDPEQDDYDHEQEDDDPEQEDDDPEQEDDDPEQEDYNIVIDNGGWMLKAGFAGDDAPKAVFPPIVGTPKGNRYIFGKDRFVGDEAQAKRGVLSIDYAIDRGNVTDWDKMEAIWHHTFYNALRVDPAEYNCLMTSKPYSTTASHEKTAELLCETFNCTGFYLTLDAILASYAAGKRTSVVLDVGDGVTCCVPVYEGYACRLCNWPMEARRMDIGGRDCTEYLRRLSHSNFVIDFSKSHTSLIADIKEKVGYVAVDFKQELKHNLQATSYELPDGSELEVGAERFKCFEPLMKKHLAAFVDDTVMKYDVDTRNDLWGNIVLCGGTTLTRGFVERFSAELKAVRPGAVFVAPSERKYSVWIGGSILAELQGTFEDMLVSKSEYDESGPSIIWRKCSSLVRSEGGYQKWRYEKLPDEDQTWDYRVYLIQNYDGQNLNDDNITSPQTGMPEQKSNHDDRTVSKEAYDILTAEKQSLELLVNELRQQQTVTMSENDSLKQQNQTLTKENMSLNEECKQQNQALTQENMALNEECKQCKLELQQVQAQYKELRRNQKLDLSIPRVVSGGRRAVDHHPIMSLDHGAFQKYEAKLTESFAQSEFDGSSLNDVLKSDIADFGINNFRDKTALYKHIENLKIGQHVQSSQPQIAPAEGGGTLQLY